MNPFHFFVPHKKNNHRAKLLHNLTLFALIIAIAVVSSFSVVIYKTNPDVLGIYYQISERELTNLTNYERELQGLSPLSYNSSLQRAAQKKGEHMLKNDYWAHYAPDGTTPWDFIRAENYDYVYAGENLAKGYTTSIDAVKAWMNSPSHKANILSKDYKEVGFAILEGRLSGEETILIVQELGTSTGAVIASNPNEVQGSQIQMPEVIPQNVIYEKPVIDISVIAKALTFILLSALLIALILDFVIIEKKKIPRMVGNNLDHIMLVTIFIAFLFMARLGHVI